MAYFDKNGRTKLFRAAKRGDAATLKTLISEPGRDLDVIDSLDETPLVAAIRGNHIQCCQMLVEAKADLEACIGETGGTAIMTAIAEGRVDCVKLLIEARADLDAVDMNGETPETLAEELHGTSEIFNLILGGYEALIALKTSTSSALSSSAATPPATTTTTTSIIIPSAQVHPSPSHPPGGPPVNDPTNPTFLAHATVSSGNGMNQGVRAEATRGIIHDGHDLEPKSNTKFDKFGSVLETGVAVANILTAPSDCVQDSPNPLMHVISVASESLSSASGVAKSVLTLIEDIYKMCKAYNTRDAWLSRFCTELDWIYKDLVEGEAIFERTHFLPRVFELVVKAREKIHTITHRGFLGQLFLSRADMSDLDNYSDTLHRMRHDALFSMMLEVKQDTAKLHLLYSFVQRPSGVAPLLSSSTLTTSAPSGSPPPSSFPTSPAQEEGDNKDDAGKEHYRYQSHNHHHHDDEKEGQDEDVSVFATIRQELNTLAKERSLLQNDVKMVQELIGKFAVAVESATMQKKDQEEEEEEAPQDQRKEATSNEKPCPFEEVKRFDHYKAIPYSHLTEIKFLASGNFGDVYEATWFGEKVAVKRVRKLKTKRATAAAFLEELNVSRLLGNHHRILQVVGMCDPCHPHNNVASKKNHHELWAHYCIVSKHKNCSLDKLLTKSKKKKDSVLLPSQLVQILLDVANALWYLHSHNVIHRDIAARNVLISDDGHGSLCDFGMSKVLKEGEEKGRIDGVVFGPLRWMSPSMASGEYSCLTDLWMFGMLLVEVVTGRVPYAHVEHKDVAKTILCRNPITINNDSDNDSKNQVPGRLMEIIHYCCCHDYKDNGKNDTILTNATNMAPSMNDPTNHSSSSTIKCHASRTEGLRTMLQALKNDLEKEEEEVKKGASPSSSSTFGDLSAAFLELAICNKEDCCQEEPSSANDNPSAASPYDNPFAASPYDDSVYGVYLNSFPP